MNLDQVFTQQSNFLLSARRFISIDHVWKNKISQFVMSPCRNQSLKERDSFIKRVGNQRFNLSVFLKALEDYSLIGTKIYSVY